MIKHRWHILAAVVLVIVGFHEQTIWRSRISKELSLEELIGLVALTTFLVGFSQLRLQSRLEDIRSSRSRILDRVLEQNSNQGDLLPLPSGLIAGLSDQEEDRSLVDRTTRVTHRLAVVTFVLSTLLWLYDFERNLPLRLEFALVQVIHLVVVILGFVNSDSVKETAQTEKSESPFSLYQELESELQKQLNDGGYNSEEGRLKLERDLDRLEAKLPDWVWSTLLRCTLNLEAEPRWPETVRVASKDNKCLEAGNADIDGVTLVRGDRILVVSDFVIYTHAGKDESSEKIRYEAKECLWESVFVEEGNTYRREIVNRSSTKGVATEPEPKKKTEALAGAEINLDRIFTLADKQRETDDFALLAYVWSAYLREAYSTLESPFLASFYVKNNELEKLYRRGLLRGLKRNLRSYSVYSELAFKTAAWVTCCKRGILSDPKVYHVDTDPLSDEIYDSPIGKVLLRVSTALREQPQRQRGLTFGLPRDDTQPAPTASLGAN